VNKANQLLSIVEGKWKHDEVGKSGSISVFQDGGSTISFEVDSNKQKWSYKKNKDGYVFMDDKTNDAYADAAESGNIRGMTKIAKQLLG